MKIISTRPLHQTTVKAAGAGHLSQVPRDTLVVSDQALFRIARVAEIAKMFPCMASVRELEHTLTSKSCRSCKFKRSQVQIDRSPLDRAVKQLAECSEDKARLVCQALSVAHYRVHYKDDHGNPHTVTR